MSAARHKPHALERLAAAVDKTHPSLGPMIATAVMCVVARRMLLIVAPAGCGKSAAGRLLLDTHPDCHSIDSVTAAGLRDWVEAFTDFDGAVVSDDLGKTGNLFLRKDMLLAFAELVYGGSMQRGSTISKYSITGFRGSAVFNCQPIVLQRVIELPEWESNLNDKTIRYYHLYRPTDPVTDPINVRLAWDWDASKVAEPDMALPEHAELVRFGLVQWGRARAKEHVRSMLRATAAIDRRTVVSPEDARVLRELMRPMVVERVVMDKHGWEDGRSFNTGKLCLMIELATYESISLEDLAADYKINESVGRGLMAAQSRWWTPAGPGGTRYTASPEMRNILDKLAPKLGKGISTNGRNSGSDSEHVTSESGSKAV